MHPPGLCLNITYAESLFELSNVMPAPDAFERGWLYLSINTHSVIRFIHVWLYMSVEGFCVTPLILLLYGTQLVIS